MMNDRIEEFVNDIFKKAPVKRRIIEMREELLANMNAKFADLIDQGMDEEVAYSTVLSGIGDINSLIDDVVEIESQSFKNAAVKNRRSLIKHRYQREDDSFAEEYKEKLSQNDRTSRINAALSSSLWTLTVLIYFLISFLTRRWDISWVIFLIGAVVQQAVSSILQGKIHWGGIIWTSTVVLYFCISFFSGRWDITWLIFIAAVAVQQIVRLGGIWREI